MNVLHAWAATWGIPDAAIDDLAARLTTQTPAAETGMLENAVQTRVRLAAPAKGYQLFRNNSGGGKLENGSFVRWGLGNDSKATNAVVKSADLIGLRTVLIEPHHVGQRIGQFASLEIKQSAWKYGTGKEFEAQLNWQLLIQARGGHALFVTDADQI